MSLSRPSWDDYFLSLANMVASRSTCLRRKVGAVLVKDKRILATGYNGAPSGLRHCLEIGCMRDKMGIPSGERHELCRGLHAEQNALIQAAKLGFSVDGATLYCTTFPCSICAKMLINAGIIRIVYLEGYPDKLTEGFMLESNMKCIQKKIK
jgi:dCMP deaminase